MNKGILIVGIILLALIALNLLNVINNVATGSELDYYLLKETTDASLQDAIDPMFRTTCGLYRIDKEKFVESFLYRFASNVDETRSYKIGFYDINELPPKVSVKVDSLTTLSFDATDGGGENEHAVITTTYDAILETNYISDVRTEVGLKDKNSTECKSLLKLYDLEAEV
ncbi:MAG: hypothetical protein IKF71_03170 [Bacilli bacterium]|nr:hypothetical protein [Bacilli bacterium]